MLLEAAIAELPRGEVMMGSRASTTTMTLLQDDHEFSSRILKKDVSNRARFAYKSSATIQAGGIPFQWETEPGKLKNLNTKDEEEYMFPITLPPIRIPSSSNSPSSSRAQSPSSSTSKVIKSLVMNVKRPESSTNHSQQESSFSRSPSTISSPREKKSFLSSLYEPLQSSGSPHCSATSNLGESHFKEDFTASRSSNLVYRSPLLYSPYTPSPYYFSPLSNTSSQSSDTNSRRNSIAHGPDSPAEFNPITTSHGLEKPKTHPNASNGSISSTPRALGNSPLFIPSFSHVVEDNGVQNGGDSLSFASPEMEILDEGLMANYNASRGGAENTMAEFINRGGPKMHRSFSTSRVTFADDYKRKSTQRKYYSAQLNASEQPKKNVVEVEDPTCSALDKLFPLKRPNQFKAGAAIMASNSHLEEQMDVNLGCSNVGGMGHLSTLLEIRAAQEVVIQASDEEGFAYTPVASAFVFSPRRASQNSYFMRSSSAKVLKERGASTNQGQQEIKSILKKTSYSHELVHGVHTESQRALHHPGSHKISSVLLRFAEAQERLYNSAPTSPHHHRHHHSSTMPTTTCLQPMCSFLGRAFLCRSKLATGHLHE